MLRALWNWLKAQVPTDEDMGAAPLNDAEIKARMRDLEVCREVAFKALAARNTTTSPIHRKAS